MSQLQLWKNFSKRRNSTLTPPGSADVFKDVLLKDNTSVHKPEFQVSTVDWSWNYAWWNGKYYYINDIIQNANNLFTLVCQIDLPATFKQEIGNYETLISRASKNSAWDTEVIDTIYPAKAVPAIKETVYAKLAQFTVNRTNATIIMGTVGRAGHKFYMMSNSAFQNVASFLFPLTGQQDFDQWVTLNVTQAAVGGLQSIMSNIVMLKWIPCVYSAMTDVDSIPVSNISIGNWNVNITGQGTDPVRELTGNTIHNIWTAAVGFKGRGDTIIENWKYLTPFASYSLFMPPFGLIPIDGTYLRFETTGTASIYVDYDIDIITGNATLRLSTPALTSVDSKMLYRGTINLGFDLKAGGGSMNMIGQVGGAAAAVAAIATENYSGAIGAIGSAISSSIPDVGQVGGGISGPYPDLTIGPRTYSAFYDPIEENTSELGKPVGAIYKIKDLGGFVQTARAKLAIPGHAAEMTELNMMLDEGIFYE